MHFAYQIKIDHVIGFPSPLKTRHDVFEVFSHGFPAPVLSLFQQQLSWHFNNNQYTDIDWRNITAIHTVTIYFTRSHNSKYLNKKYLNNTYSRQNRSLIPYALISNIHLFFYITLSSFIVPLQSKCVFKQSIFVHYGLY